MHPAFSFFPKTIHVRLLLIVLGQFLAADIDRVSGSISSFAADKIALSDLNIVRLLNSYRDKIPQDSSLLPLVNLYLSSFERGTGFKVTELNTSLLPQNCPECEKDEEQFYLRVADNPIFTVKLFLRYHTQIPTLVQNEELAKYFNLSKHVVSPKDFPADDDFDSAIHGILRLQQIYNISCSQFASGNFSSLLTTPKNGRAMLDLCDLYSLALKASEFGYFSLAHQWLDLAEQRQEQKTTQEECTHESLVVLKEKILLNFKNESHRALWLNFDPDHPVRPLKDQEEMEKFYANVSALCSGKNLQSEKEKASLFCWLETSVDKYFWIGPMKMELLSRSPLLILTYEVVGPKLIKKILEKSAKHSKLKVNLMEDYNDEDQLKFDATMPPNASYVQNFGRLFQFKNVTYGQTQRESMASFADDSKKMAMDGWAKMVQYISLLVNLKKNPLTIISYNFDGHVIQHVDKAKDGDITRIATVLVNLVTVNGSGSTVYTEAGVSIPPIAGSLFFHFNSFRNGFHRDPKSLHYGCPPILGRKVISSKLIVYEDQIDTFNCGLNELDEIDWDFMKQFYSPKVRSL